MERKQSISGQKLISIMFTLTTISLLFAVQTSALALSQEKTAFVGQFFSGSVEMDENSIELIKESLPLWLQLQPNTSTVVQGVPQEKDIGKHMVLVSDSSDPIEIEVVEETKNECGEQNTNWIEILDNRLVADVPLEEQNKFIHNLLASITGSSTSEDVKNNASDFRIFPVKYLSRYRTINKIYGDAPEEENDPVEELTSDKMAIVFNVSCEELNEYALEAIDALPDIFSSVDGVKYRVISGRLNQARARLPDTTTTGPITRTTRQVYYPSTNNKPIGINLLKTFTCKKGILCQLTVSENTFMDAEDGNTRKLHLSVHSIGKENQRNFLLALPYSTQLEGVPLEVGTFDFRLEARNRANKTASLPFQVKVEESFDQKPNHQFSMILEGSIEKFTSKPEVLRDFVYRLAQSINGQHFRQSIQQYPLYSQPLAMSIKIYELVENGGAQTILRWSNTTLSRKVCQIKLINETHKQMVTGRNLEKVRHEFKKQMGSQFHVRKITLDLLRSCLPSSNLLVNFKIKATTIETSVDSEPASSFADTMMMPLILLACLLFFIMLLIVLCWMQRKGAGQKKKKKQQGDYVSKGLPVVFPEEVPHEDDTNQPTVTTPMLVNREQPPIDPGRMTMHENPLYKPPPTTQATLVKQSPPTTTTFTSSGPKINNSGLGRLGSSSTVAPRTNQGAIAALGQRLPPPYVAAL